MSSIKGVIAVTPGPLFTDIDGLACAIAYAELLNSQNKHAIALLPGPINSSITPTVRAWGLHFETVVPAEARIVLVDVSAPEALRGISTPQNVIEIFDHHTGHEQYWSERIGESAHIEFIGAASTLVWERIDQSGFADKLSQTSMRLIYTGIISNTLNFSAGLTSQRDHNAFASLKPRVALPNEWPAQYYAEVDDAIISNAPLALKNDIKIVPFPNLGLTIAVSQLEMWDGARFVHEHVRDIKAALRATGHPWFHTTPSISERKNHLYTEDDNLKTLLKTAIGAHFDGNFGHTDRLWMRKEIQKQLQKLPES